MINGEYFNLCRVVGEASKSTQDSRTDHSDRLSIDVPHTHPPRFSTGNDLIRIVRCSDSCRFMRGPKSVLLRTAFDPSQVSSVDA